MRAVSSSLSIPAAALCFLLGAAANAADDGSVFKKSIVRGDGPAEVDVDLSGAKRLWLVVTDGGDGYSCDWADWIEPRLEGPSGSLKLTEIAWKEGTADWGAVRVNKNAGGGPLRTGGKPVEYGIGTHANSVIEFEVPAGYSRFKARVALDNGGTDQGGGSVEFRVYTRRPARPAVKVERRGDGPRSPEEALEALETHEGIEATLFASEPMVFNPTDMDIDERGRVWITEGVNYRAWQKLRPEGDRIVILEDSDKDGKADSAKVYYQDPSINSALGICVLGNRVIVSVSPNVFVFTDTDGDDRPDRKEMLFSGIAGVQHDHGAHAFVFGPDGKLYFNIGNDGRRLQDAMGRTITDRAGNMTEANGKPYRQGMVFRSNQDGTEVETLGHNFRNNYEVCVDSFGTLWQSDNDDDGNRGVRINYVMEFGNFGYTDERTGAGWGERRTNMEPEIPARHWHQNDPGVVPNYLVTGAGSPTGICVYEGALLPAVFRDQVIHCDAGPRVVRAYPAAKSGAGYAANTVDLVTSPDTWFRPADVCTAPDGSLYVADWYDAGVGGHAMADSDPNAVRGRVYRLAPPGTRPSVPTLDLATPEGAAIALQSPNLSRRHVAWTALSAMGERARGPLETLWREGSPRLRARALQLLARISGRKEEYISGALRDGDPDIRITGLRIVRSLGLDVIPAVRQLVHDPAAEVRRECAIALRHVTAAGAEDLWAELALQHDGSDRWYLEALGIGADRQHDRYFDAWLSRAGDGWSTPAGRDIVWRSRAAKAAGLLARIIEDPRTQDGERLRCLRAFDFLDGPGKDRALALLLASRSKLVAAEALDRLKGFDPAANREHGAILAELLAANRGTPQFVSLVEKFHLAGQGEGLLESLLASPADSTGAQAARLLLDLGEASRLEAALGGEDDTVALRAAVALANARDPRAVPLFVPIAASADADEQLGAQAVRGLASTKQGAGRLLDLARSGKLASGVRTVAAVSLSSVIWDEVRTAAAAVLPLPPSKDNVPLPPIPALAALPGDSTEGLKVFEAQCKNCHVAGDRGKDFGPALTEIGDKLGKDALFLSILDPSAGISFNYEGEVVSLKSGTDVVAIVVSESPDKLTLKSEGAIVATYPKDEVASRARLKTSIMPSDLQKNMTRADLVNLVEFLSGLKKPAGK